MIAIYPGDVATTASTVICGARIWASSVTVYAEARVHVTPPRGFRYRVHPRLGILVLHEPLPRAEARLRSSVRPPAERSRQRHVVHVRERCRFH